MDTAANKEIYVLKINGYAPELWRGMAFRRSGRFQVGRQKIIKCPYCGKPLTAIDTGTTVELYRSPRREDVFCHEYRKCYACKEMVGFIFSSG